MLVYRCSHVETMLKLYITNKNYSSWSLRPWVLMSELGIPFDEELLVFGDEDAWDSFRQISPKGLVPCLVDDETVVWDSLALAEYLAEEYPAVWPVDKTARAWARCAAAEMHSGFSALRNQCSMSCGVRVQLHSTSAELTADIKRIEQLWSEGFEKFGGPFLAGDKFTAVDAFYAPVAFRIQTYGLSLTTKFSQDYVERLLGLESMKDWYTAGMLETFRDQSHEQEIEAVGHIVSDVRATS
jgi:glutathione S-transferase